MQLFLEECTAYVLILKLSTHCWILWSMHRAVYALIPKPGVLYVLLKPVVYAGGILLFLLWRGSVSATLRLRACWCQPMRRCWLACTAHAMTLQSSKILTGGLSP